MLFFFSRSARRRLLVCPRRARFGLMPPPPPRVDVFAIVAKKQNIRGLWGRMGLLVQHWCNSRTVYTSKYCICSMFGWYWWYRWWPCVTSQLYSSLPAMAAFQLDRDGDAEGVGRGSFLFFVVLVILVACCLCCLTSTSKSVPGV